MLKAIVTTEMEFYHKWNDAPEEEGFLKNLHRHILKIRIEIEQFHNDREIEYIKVKKGLNKFLKEQVFPETFSCEMVAQEILRYLQQRYAYTRWYEVIVMEDNENGCSLTPTRESDG